jgi:DNA polymerase-1
MPSLQVQPNSSILVDSNAYMYRFFYGSEPRHNQDGNPVHVIYAFMAYARRLLQAFRPEQLVFVFDAPGENFRHELYPEYKSHRDPMPEDLAGQIDHIKQALRHMGIPIVEEHGVEADDSIASLSKLLSDRGDTVYIFSLDKDLMQLINSQVYMVDDRKGILIDSDYVTNKYGIEPARIVEMLALTGDEADNIPGVEGIGVVTAARLINQWGSIENIIQNSHWVKGVVGNNLRRGVDSLRLSQELTQLKTSIFDQSIFHRLHILPEDKYSVHHFCRSMGFQL